jgi:hypothetical protein
VDAITYVLPIRSQTAPDSELTDYLRLIAGRVPVIVVDGSPPDVFARNRCEWEAFAQHVAPSPELDCANGKARGVNTALAMVTTPLMVIADDDVRYAPEQLARVVMELADADLVVPQNYFDPAPWHARWDAGRSLINRVSGGDFPGTLALRRASLPAEGYDGDVLFENLEMIRTVIAGGGRVARLPELFVRRLPPNTTHFVGQRVRQAYDEWARPARMLAWSCVLPLWAISSWRWRRSAAVIPALAVAAAELGRRRNGARRYFHWTSSLLAPAWVLERSITIWVAIGLRARGGARYAGRRLACAAHSVDELRARNALVVGSSRP